MSSKYNNKLPMVTPKFNPSDTQPSFGSKRRSIGCKKLVSFYLEDNNASQTVTHTSSKAKNITFN